MEVIVWWRGIWWSLEFLDEEHPVETCFLDYIDRSTQGQTHVLDFRGGGRRFNHDRSFVIWYNIREQDINFLVSFCRVRDKIEFPGNWFGPNFGEFLLPTYDDLDTYEFTIAVRRVYLVSRVLKDGDHAIARRVLGCLFRV